LKNEWSGVEDDLRLLLLVGEVWLLLLLGEVWLLLVAYPSLLIQLLVCLPFSSLVSPSPPRCLLQLQVTISMVGWLGGEFVL
jgi:hypothetical protein